MLSFIVFVEFICRTVSQALLVKDTEEPRFPCTMSTQISLPILYRTVPVLISALDPDPDRVVFVSGSVPINSKQIKKLIN
jgi:hypothetical protein